MKFGTTYARALALTASGIALAFSAIARAHFVLAATDRCWSVLMHTRVVVTVKAAVANRFYLFQC